jgi:cell division protein FtsL
MRRVPQQYPNVNVRREHDPRTARRRTLLLAGCLALAAGFVFAVRQQIVAVELGYKTEALRREREKLTDEQRRLILAIEEHTAPAQLERAARELGMQPTRAKQIAGPATQAEGGPADEAGDAAAADAEGAAARNGALVGAATGVTRR